MTPCLSTTENAMPSSVTEIAPAPGHLALAHFERIFEYETDCWDVHDAMTTGRQDFVLLDVRSPALYAKGHIPGAVSFPHGKLVAPKLNDYPMDTIFVVYCAGPHCNGAQRAAVRLARLGRPVKTMPGGITGWLDEEFPLETGSKE
jgi:rhodanese-related sulfurtransferase